MVVDYRVGAAPPTAALTRFPPGRWNILVPARPARDAARAVALYTATGPLTLAAQWGMWLTARLGGGRVLPGPRTTWRPPGEAADVDELWHAWTSVLAGPTSSVAVYERPQASRAAVILLLAAGTDSVLIRARRKPTGLARERAIAEAAARLRPTSFRVPAVRGHGRVGEWHWTASEVISSRPRTVFRGDPRVLHEEISETVESVLPRPAGTPDHWRGAHGDLAPWNALRSRGVTWLIDWEDSRWAPPGADLVYLTATRAAVTRGRPQPLPEIGQYPEAAAFWADQVRSRIAVDGPNPLNNRLLVLLGENP